MLPSSKNMSNLGIKYNAVAVIDVVLRSANPTRWLNTLRQFVGKWPTNCLSVFDHFVGLALKGLTLNFRHLIRN